MESEPTPITTEEAGAQYLGLVGPVNAQVSPWNDAIESGDWAQVRALSGPYADEMRAFADQLMAAEWPTEVQPVVDSLVAELAGEIQGLVRMAASSTDAATAAELNAIPVRSGTAQQLRMMLGLDNVPAG